MPEGCFFVLPSSNHKTVHFCVDSLGVGGNRNNSSGAVNNLPNSNGNYNGNYWSSEVSGTNASNFNFNSNGNSNTNSNNRANGRAVRCVKNLQTNSFSKSLLIYFMTFKEIWEQEQTVRDCAILHNEGLLWKAYERSAFLICQYVRQFKISRRSFNALDGAEMVSVGFPDITLNSLMEGHLVISKNGSTVIYGGFPLIDEKEFARWKTSVPILVTKPVSSASPLASNNLSTSSDRKKEVPYYSLPVFDLTLSVFTKMVTDKTLISVPKHFRHQIVDASLDFLWAVMGDIYTVRDLEQDDRQTHDGNRSKEAVSTLTDAYYKLSRVIVSFRMLYHLQYIPTELYLRYTRDLSSAYRQIGFWRRKHLTIQENFADRQNIQ